MSDEYLEHTSNVDHCSPSSSYAMNHEDEEKYYDQRRHDTGHKSNAKTCTICVSWQPSPKKTVNSRPKD